MADRAQDIPISQIVEPHALLRLVDRDSIEYLEMRDSLRDHGFLNSIAVRPAAPDLYEIIDGFYRYTCSKELGFTSLPCIIKENVDDQKYLIYQLQAQAIRPETKPVEFANQLRKMLQRAPEMTFSELGHLVRKSPKWIGERLGLLHLIHDARKAVDRGEVPLKSAFMLAKIPRHLQSRHLDQARTWSPREFCDLAAGVIKQFAEAVKQGKMDAFWTAEFKPHPFLRPLKEVVREMDQPQAGSLIVVAEGCKSALDGFYAALRWVARLDAMSLKERKAIHAIRTKERTVDHVTGLEKD